MDTIIDTKSYQYLTLLLSNLESKIVSIKITDKNRDAIASLKSFLYYDNDREYIVTDDTLFISKENLLSYISDLFNNCGCNNTGIRINNDYHWFCGCYQGREREDVAKKLKMTALEYYEHFIIKKFNDDEIPF